MADKEIHTRWGLTSGDMLELAKMYGWDQASLDVEREKTKPRVVVIGDCMALHEVIANADVDVMIVDTGLEVEGKEITAPDGSAVIAHISGVHRDEKEVELWRRSLSYGDFLPKRLSPSASVFTIAR